MRIILACYITDSNYYLTDTDSEWFVPGTCEDAA
jgi:hypothetical protein